MCNVFSSKKHVLVISSEPRALVEIKIWLMKHFDVSIASGTPAALVALEINQISAIVIDIVSNIKEAFAVFSGISGLAQRKGVPIILLMADTLEDGETGVFESSSEIYTVKKNGGAEALCQAINTHAALREHTKQTVNGEDAPLSLSADPEAVLSGKTILVADDIELNREFVAAIFSGIDGLTIDLACDGREAVCKFEENSGLYSFILMDIQMPEMDGLTAARTIRGLNHITSRDIPIIALTASVDEAEIAACYKAGMNDYIEKPLAYDKLLDMAMKYC